MADPRRDYSLGRSGARLGTLGRAGARLGKLWLGDWDAAHSPWADQFDLIINCCHKEGKYRRWPIRDKNRNDNFTHPFGGDGGGGGGGGFGGGTPYHLNTRAWKLGKQVFVCE